MGGAILCSFLVPQLMLKACDVPHVCILYLAFSSDHNEA